METVVLVIKCLEGCIPKLFILMQNKVHSTKGFVDSLELHPLDTRQIGLQAVQLVFLGSVSSKWICIP